MAEWSSLAYKWLWCMGVVGWMDRGVWLEYAVGPPSLGALGASGFVLFKEVCPLFEVILVPFDSFEQKVW